VERRSDEHHVKPIAWVIAAGIILASVGGAVFVTEWRPMTRDRAGRATRAPLQPAASKRFVLPLERASVPAPRTTDPSDPSAALYVGVSRLVGGDAVGAIDPLSAAVRLSTGSMERDARWYLAVALERAGRPADAASVLDQLCAAGAGDAGGPATAASATTTTATRTAQSCEAAATLRRSAP
jgi:hypothetical protein